MNPFDIYATMRTEIISNHVLMHWFSIIVAITLMIGVWFVENRKTIISVFLPLLSLAWAASMVRFDFFIHRQAAYLRLLESQLLEKGTSGPLWETWKASSKSTPFVVPALDVIAVGVIVIPTLYLLFGPAQELCQTKGWGWARIYAWSVSMILFLLLVSLVAIPKIAGH
ncbi:MAG: hypothetical protein ACR2H4_12735 [Pyrinomonadaceae bacterium]